MPKVKMNFYEIVTIKKIKIYKTNYKHYTHKNSLHTKYSFVRNLSQICHFDKLLTSLHCQYDDAQINKFQSTTCQ